MTPYLWLNFILILALSPYAGRPPFHKSPDGTAVRRAVACLLTKDWVKQDLDGIGLSMGKPALVRFRSGSIPGTSPATPHMLNIIVYSSDGHSALMFFMRNKRDGSIAAVHNGYTLTQDGNQWAAGEGNGGLATYRAVGAYATDMAKGRAIKLALEPANESCPTEE
jgi:hypothetical protein